MKGRYPMTAYSLLAYLALGFLLTIGTIILGACTNTFRATGVFLERPLAAHVGLRWENRWSTVVDHTTSNAVLDPYLAAGVRVVDTDDSKAWQRSIEDLLAANGFNPVFRRSRGWPLRCSSYLALVYREEGNIRVGHTGWEVGGVSDTLVHTIVLPNGETRTYEMKSIPRYVLPSRFLWLELATDVLCLAALCAGVHGLFRLGRRALRRGQTRCPGCGYSMTGIDGICPECGVSGDARPRERG